MGNVLSAMQADRFSVMAGDDVLRAGLGMLSRQGLSPVVGPQSPPLLSNLSGNGTEVVIGAAGVIKNSYSDGVYQLVGAQLTSLASPDLGLYGPTIDAQGNVTAVHVAGGFSVLPVGTRTWTSDPRLSHTQLSSVSYGVDGVGYAVIDANSPSARLVALSPHGGAVRSLGSAHCAALVLRAPSGSDLVLSAPVHPKPCGVTRGRVVDVRTGRARVLPAGWRPLAWSRDGSTLLVSDQHLLIAVNVQTLRTTATADVGVHVWMAAAIWK